MSGFSLPETESGWHLTGHAGDSDRIQQVAINSSPFRVGRGSSASLCIPDRTVSKLHAEVMPESELLKVRDLQSTNGTYINGEQITTEGTAGEGDLLQFANVVYRVGREQTSSALRTVREGMAARTIALVHFDRLITERAVTPAFQPIVSLDPSAKGTFGFEVLARSDIEGLEDPRSMFAIAADLDLESELSRMLRWEGIHAGARLSGAPMLFVNTHPKEMDGEELVTSLKEVRESVTEQSITLEIHEKAVAQPTAMSALRAVLRDLEMQLAYDDFGAGQARLIELAEVPPDYLKFDMCFIRGIHEAPVQRQRMLESLVHMVKDMGITPLAEGIETVEESSVCRQIGFELAQGYYYGKPAPLAAYEPVA